MRVSFESRYLQRMKDGLGLRERGATATLSQPLEGVVAWGHLRYARDVRVVIHERLNDAAEGQ